jgi:sugar O-acyltransferase (sialic acid O-acetyltransferase NeuD family)
MKLLAIIGSGDLGQQIAHHVQYSSDLKVVGFIDDFAERGSVKNRIKVIGKVNEIDLLFQQGVFDCLLIGIGYKHFALREAIFDRFKGIIPFATFIHPSSYVDPTCEIGEGVVIYPGSTLDMKVKIEDNVLINIGCNIAHDSSIGRHSFISPGVSIAGFVSVGKRTSLGIGTVVIDNIKIDDDIRTGGGAVIVKHIDQKGLYIGIPAAKKNEI